MRFLVTFFLGIAVLVPSQQQKTPPATTTPDCLQFSMEGRINGGQEYTHELGGGLRMRLVSAGEKGWIIEVQPLDSADDYAYSVNPPFHFGNSQWLATAYGETVEEQLKQEHEVFFVLNRTEYKRAMKLVENALAGSPPDAFEKLLSMRSAVLRVKPIEYEVTNAGEDVDWMRFTVTVITPASFRPASGFDTTRVTCPSKRL